MGYIKGDYSYLINSLQFLTCREIYEIMLAKYQIRSRRFYYFGLETTGASTWTGLDGDVWWGGETSPVVGLVCAGGGTV